jgi:hypothetical protein
MTDRLEELCGQISLTERERVGIQVTEEEIADTQAIGGKCLVGKIWTEKAVNKEALRTVLTGIWRISGGVNIKELQDNLWLFEFSDDLDKTRIMEGRPWSFDRRIIVLNDFDGRTPPSQLDFSHSPVWVQVHDLPLLCMNKAVGTKIGASLGQLMDVDVAGDGAGWGRCLRIRVTLDLTKPLDRGRALNLGGKTSWVEFRYEKLPLFCFRCGCIVHGPRGCPVPSSSRVNTDDTKKWGVWLRAIDPSRRRWGGGGTYRGDARRSTSPANGGENGGEDDVHPDDSSSRMGSPELSRQLRHCSPLRGDRGATICQGGVGQVATAHNVVHDRGPQSHAGRAQAEVERAARIPEIVGHFNGVGHVEIVQHQGAETVDVNHGPVGITCSGDVVCMGLPPGRQKGKACATAPRGGSPDDCAVENGEAGATCHANEAAGILIQQKGDAGVTHMDCSLLVSPVDNEGPTPTSTATEVYGGPNVSALKAWKRLARAPRARNTIVLKKQGSKRNRKAHASLGEAVGEIVGKRVRRTIVIPTLLDEEEAEADDQPRLQP